MPWTALTVTNIITLLSKDFIFLVFISLIIASPVAWYFMNQWLENFAYRIHIRWWIFVLAGSGAILIALSTVSFQAVKAAIMNPVTSRRSERMTVKEYSKVIFLGDDGSKGF